MEVLPTVVLWNRQRRAFRRKDPASAEIESIKEPFNPLNLCDTPRNFSVIGTDQYDSFEADCPRSNHFRVGIPIDFAVSLRNSKMIPPSTQANNRYAEVAEHQCAKSVKGRF